jgi:hypothetical protein
MFYESLMCKISASKNAALTIPEGIVRTRRVSAARSVRV